jgi:flagellin
MGLRINTNIPALVAQRNLRNTRGALDKTLERLSSGSRINHAGDDAAGLAISESLRAQIRGLGQAERNSQDGISLVQVAESALGEISNIIIRLRELGVQAASDTVGPEERGFLDREYQQMMEEIDRISNSTEFNRVPLLNGTASTFEVQVGTRNNPTIDRIKLFDSASADVNVIALGLNLTSVKDKTNAQNSLEALDKALQQVTGTRAEFGAIQNRLQSDADLAEETSELTKNQILLQSGTAVLGQANSTVKSVLSLLGNQG